MSSADPGVGEVEGAGGEQYPPGEAVHGHQQGIPVQVHDRTVDINNHYNTC